MKKAVITTILFTIIIGVVALAFNNAFGYQTITYLQKEQINFGASHFYIWKFDYWPYLKNIQLTTSNLSVLQFNAPTRSWNDDILNNLAVIVDYLILIVNMLLYPLKLGSYLLQNIMAVLGINTDTTADNNGLSWLIIFVRDILGNIVIPYI